MPIEPIEPERPGEEEKIANRLERAHEGFHSVYLDGKNLSKSDYAESAKEIAKLGKDVVKRFFDTFDDVMRQSILRCDNWQNDLTRPPRDKANDPDYGVHFVIDIDSKSGWAEFRTWKRCKAGSKTEPDGTEKPCPERYWQTKKREQNEM